MTGPYAGGVIDTIDARIATLTSTDRRTGTVVTRDLTGPYAQVTIDPGSTAVPVKVLAHVDVFADDRVVLERFGGDWVVVGTFTRRATSANLIGGKWYTTPATLAAAIAGTEALANVDTGVLVLPANKTVRIVAQVIAESSALSTTYLFRIRDTGLSGTQRHEHLWIPDSLGQGYAIRTEALYQTAAVAESVTWVLTCIRLSGAGTVDVKAATGKSVYMTAEVVGPSTSLTAV